MPIVEFHMYDPQNVCVAWTPCGVGSKLKRYVENLNRQHFPGHHFEISASLEGRLTPIL